MHEDEPLRGVHWTIRRMLERVRVSDADAGVHGVPNTVIEARVLQQLPSSLAHARP